MDAKRNKDFIIRTTEYCIDKIICPDNIATDYF